MHVVDTVIVGNGPSALLLSYILHGHIPYYKGGHHDDAIDQRLRARPNLLAIPPRLYDHLRSSVRYTSQALPVNALLDTLILPHGDADFDTQSCVEWRAEADKAVPHLVLGNASSAGGQWADNPVEVGQDIGTLSYSEQLNLPGYSFSKHWRATKNEPLPELIRPSRKDVAAYYAAYPKAANIEDSMRNATHVSSIRRSGDGFVVSPQDIWCKRLVLATGIFSIAVPPPPLLSPLVHLPHKDGDKGPLLIIGSGFTAADIIISTPANRKIIHIFNWDPENRPSPLKACHHRAYPEYAFIYRQMKYAAALRSSRAGPLTSGDRPLKPKSFKTEFRSFGDRDWQATYEGLPNSRVLQVEEPGVSSPSSDWKSRLPSSKKTLTVQVGRSSVSEGRTKEISGFYYAAGRRGSLSYLEPSLYREVLPGSGLAAHLNPDVYNQRTLSLPAIVPTQNSEYLSVAADPDSYQRMRRASEDHDFALEPSGNTELISGQTLRGKIEDTAEEDEEGGSGNACGLEVAKDVFVIGSLTGDSLVRFAYGSCTIVASKIMAVDAATNPVTSLKEDLAIPDSSTAEPNGDVAGPDPVNRLPLTRVSTALHNSTSYQQQSQPQPQPQPQHPPGRHSGPSHEYDQLDRRKQQDRDSEQLVHPVSGGESTPDSPPQPHQANWHRSSGAVAPGLAGVQAAAGAGATPAAKTGGQLLLNPEKRGTLLSPTTANGRAVRPRRETSKRFSLSLGGSFRASKHASSPVSPVAPARDRDMNTQTQTQNQAQEPGASPTSSPKRTSGRCIVS